MKKAVKLISLLSVSVLYCFVISLYSGNALTAGSAFSNLSDSQGKNSSKLVVPDQLCTSGHAEVTAPVFHTAPPTSSKPPFHTFSAWVKLAERVFFTAFSQYTFYSQNLLLRFEQTDIIFPFHCFL